MTKPADLTAYLFEGLPQRDAPDHLRIDAALAAELTQWMEASMRFTAFVETYRDKIRKKIRVTRTAESMLDVRAELEVAYGLLNDRRLAVNYEPYASAKRRGPDFSVAYRVNQVFNVEVAHLRVEESLLEGQALAIDMQRVRKEERILRILLDKLGQMQPGMPNLLVIHTRAELAQTIDLDRLMQAFKTRVEGKDAAFFSASRYSSPAAFYKDFLRLSGILLWANGGKLWINKQARPVLDEKILRVVALTVPAQTEPSS